MAILKDLTDEHTELASARYRWEKYWRQIAAWVLPQTEEFNQLVNTGSNQSIMAVTGTPVAAERSKDIYDTTSLWGVDRLTAGLISLKTPESDYWHDLSVDDDFGYVSTHEELAGLERVRNYQFKVRSNPKSGFWPSHKAAIKSMVAFGDGWQYVEEENGSRVPFRYSFVPLAECYPAVGPDGQPNRMFRVFSWSAHQVVTKWGDKAGAKIVGLANDPKKRHQRIRVLHAVRPRSDEQRNMTGTRGSEYASWYCLPDDDILIGEGGYWEFPFTRYAWSNIGARAFCEGPVAIVIAEIQSLNEMAKNELISHQMLVRPPLATMGKNFGRLNFNPGATNPGLINGDGRPLFAALNGGMRPDLAQAVISARRNNLREMLYLNLWQVLLQEPNQGETATQAMLRAQEKGELLGPVGISLNDGLSQNNDREIGILNRKGAFDAGSPLALPESMHGRDVAPQFTSPLDRLRQIGQVIGAQRTIELAMVMEQFSPGLLSRIDTDEVIELAQRVYGAPQSMLHDRKTSQAAKAQNSQLAQSQAMIQAAKGAGDAAQSLGAGAQQAAAGAEALKTQPAVTQGIQQMIANYAQRQQPNQLPQAA
jgi:hypothetical protein